ncbi:hypothetical protein FHG87_025727 [Trinorchestia longiramus]|nr:hypothetical protein FHG87_025727 [Trinorchestia longiramus]
MDTHRYKQRERERERERKKERKKEREKERERDGGTLSIINLGNTTGQYETPILNIARPCRPTQPVHVPAVPHKDLFLHYTVRNNGALKLGLDIKVL